LTAINALVSIGLPLYISTRRTNKCLCGLLLWLLILTHGDEES